jgi:hypothetical protein
MIKSMETVLRVSMFNKPVAGVERHLLRQNLWTYRASFIYVYSMQRK